MPYKDVEKRLECARESSRRRWAKLKANPDLRREFNARHRTPLHRRREHLKGRYGLTLEQWDAMFEAQGQCCAICKSKTSGWKRGWHTDHDHRTGKVRAILCHLCNRILGHAKDDPNRLRAFISYLEKGGNGK